jgi:hypothetical protein
MESHHFCTTIDNVFLLHLEQCTITKTSNQMLWWWRIEATYSGMMQQSSKLTTD